MTSRKTTPYVPTELKELEQRQTRAQTLLKTYPERVPLIIKKSKDQIKTKDDAQVSKFLVPHTMTVANVIKVLREKIKLEPAKSIYMSVDNQYILSGSQSVGTIYEFHKSIDGFLYLVYCEESVFG
jgi:GABA(A) receptor-associated protein